MVGQGGQEQRGDTDNNRKPHCDRFALAELQHERRCDQDDREGIIDQVGVDRLGDEAERHRWLLRALVARAGSCDAGSASTQEADHAAPCWQALRTTVTYAGTPTIGNAQSLSFPFHSPGAMKRVKLVWCRASTTSPRAE